MDSKKIGLIVFFVFLFLGIIGFFLTKFLRPGQGEIIQNQSSKDRLTKLNDVMTSYFGQYWKYLFFILSIIFLVFIFILYYISQLDISNCSDAILGELKHFWIVTLIIIGLFIISLSFVIVVEIKKYVNQLGGDFVVQNNIVQILQLVFYLVGLILLIWAFFYLRKRLFSTQS